MRTRPAGMQAAQSFCLFLEETLFGLKEFKEKKKKIISKLLGAFTLETRNTNSFLFQNSHWTIIHNMETFVKDIMCCVTSGRVEEKTLFDRMYLAKLRHMGAPVHRLSHLVIDNYFYGAKPGSVPSF
ncbi:hypothetical protein EVAR_21995_1 [Eumeta japonica]|uniref:Uncharacterized protein n=1 Tax=Eumeta variegata TaxID=151549 RepID=A0A4C1YYQ1_EUMVA|nr:hypothetical protein EVAR_21995_1 [Eumeta japonica]